MARESFDEERAGAGARGLPADDPTSIVEAGRNCWRVCRASRAAMLVDGARFYAALRSALARARRSVFIIGWDVDSDVELRRDDPGDGLPLRLGPLLDALARQRRGLHAYVLDWDFVMLFAKDRQLFPAYHFDVCTHRRVHFWLDDRHPVAGSHHQKIVVVDDAVAFCGGMDIARSRWDTREHLPGDPRRTNPSGKPYGPVHDVQWMVDGEAAAALGEIARQRWQRATGRHPRGPRRGHGVDPWPPEVAPDFRDVAMGVARTAPRYDGEPGAREIEQLYLDAIAAARRTIYIENQYVSAPRIGEALAARLAEHDGPEVVIVSRASGGGWLEESTMQLMRARLLERLRAADRYRRLAVYYPHHAGLVDQWINLHSKLMVVDERLLHAGSANLANRSMGYDTECDLSLEAASPEVARTIEAIRNDLVAEHLGVEPARVAAAVAEKRSLAAAIESLRGNARTLEVLEGTVDPTIAALVPEGLVLDPERPVDAEELVSEFVPVDAHPHARIRLGTMVALLAAAVALAVAWRWGPLGEWIRTESVGPVVEHLASLPAAPLWVLAAFVVAATVAVPVTVLIFACALAFGPASAIGYTLAGSVGAAVLGFALGRVAGRRAVTRIAGRRIGALSRRLARRGILTVVAVRVIPVAPFAVVNLVAGASPLRLRHFLVGTVLGMTPGIAAISVFSDRLLAVLRAPSPQSFALLVAVALAIGAGIWTLRRWIARRDTLRGATPQPPAPGVQASRAEALLGRDARRDRSAAALQR